MDIVSIQKQLDYAKGRLNDRPEELRDALFTVIAILEELAVLVKENRTMCDQRAFYAGQD